MPKSKNYSSGLASVRNITLLGFVLLGLSGFAYWKYICSDPVVVFERMLSTSLSTPSMTKIITQNDEGQDLKQVVNLQTSPGQFARTNSELNQKESSTIISTETIGTPAADFVRYTGIKTNQKSATGKDLDFNKIINLWGKTDKSNGEVQLFNQTVLGVIPIANIRQPLRGQLIDKIEQESVYSFDRKVVKKTYVNGRLIYSYEVSIKPVAYVSMLKLVARDMGIKELEAIDPSQYANSAPIVFGIEVDVWSSQLTKITFKDSKRSERYVSFGARSTVITPNNTVPVEELQNRLQQVQ